MTFDDGEIIFKFEHSAVINPRDLAGAHYSAELDCIYRIAFRDEELFLQHSKYPDSRLTLRGRHLKRDSWFMPHMKITMDGNVITGFEVNSGRVMHLRFDRMK